MCVYIYIHIYIYTYIYTPEKRRRKPGMSLNGDRSVEGMGHGRECGGGVGMARLCGVWCVEGVERGKECGGRGRGRWKVGKGREKRREISCLHSKPLPIAWPAAIIPTTFRHSPPLSNSNTCLQPSPCDTLHTTCYALHFTHYTSHSRLPTLHCILYTPLLSPIPIFSNFSIAFLMF